MEQLGYTCLALPPAIWTGWNLAHSKSGCLLGVSPQFVSGDKPLVKRRHLDNHCLLRLVLRPIHFDHIGWRSGPLRCYYRSHNLSGFVVVCQVPYTAWSVMYSV